jgi:hypothetical protein
VFDEGKVGKGTLTVSVDGNTDEFYLTPQMAIARGVILIPFSTKTKTVDGYNRQRRRFEPAPYTLKFTLDRAVLHPGEAETIQALQAAYDSTGIPVITSADESKVVYHSPDGRNTVSRITIPVEFRFVLPHVEDSDE